MIFQDHVRVPGHKYNKVHLLGLVWDSDDVLRGEDLEEENEDCEKVKEITHNMENIHSTQALDWYYKFTYSKILYVFDL